MMIRPPALALLLALTPAFAAAAEPAAPAASIAAYNDGVVAIMKAALPLPARVTRFEALVRSHYDMAGIAALVAGSKWATATAEDKRTAIAALTRHSAVSLAKNFTRFDGERFTTDPDVQARGTSSVVRVTIAGKSDRALLQYRLRQSGGAWKILDVVAEGVSQLAVQRSELAGTIASEGLAGMARKLAEKDRI